MSHSSSWQFIVAKDWDDETRLTGEKETLGLYLTGHPIDRYEHEINQIVSKRIVGLNPKSDQNITVAGLVVAMRTMNTKRGDRIAFITLDDRTGRLGLRRTSVGWPHRPSGVETNSCEAPSILTAEIAEPSREESRILRSELPIV